MSSATITEPTVIDGQLTFPESWTSDEREDYIALTEEIAVERAALADAGEDEPEDAPSPAATAIAAKRSELNAARAERAAAELVARDAADLLNLEAKHGKGRVGRIATCDGVFYLRPLTEREIDRSEVRSANTSKVDEKLSFAKQLTLDTVTHATIPVLEARSKAAAHLANYPADWGNFFAERDRIITGIRDDAGKGA